MSDADIVKKLAKARRDYLRAIGDEEAALDWAEALAALARIEEDYKEACAMLNRLRDEKFDLKAERDRLKDQLAEARKQWDFAAKDAARFALRHADLREKLAEADERARKLINDVNFLGSRLAEADTNGLRLAEENEALRGNLKGNPVLTTFDGIANLQAHVREAEAEVERLRAALTKIVRGEEEAPVGMSNPAAIARQALEGSASEVRG